MLCPSHEQGIGQCHAALLPSLANKTSAIQIRRLARWPTLTKAQGLTVDLQYTHLVNGVCLAATSRREEATTSTVPLT